MSPKKIGRKHLKRKKRGEKLSLKGLKKRRRKGEG